MSRRLARKVVEGFHGCPRLVFVRFVRAALLYLALGLTLAGCCSANKGIPLHPLISRPAPRPRQCLLFGWTVQLALAWRSGLLPH